MKTDDLDADAAFLHNLIPPKEETSEKVEVQEKTADNATKVVEQAEAKTETVPEKNKAETVEKPATESEDKAEDKAEELTDDTGKDKTEAVDA